MKVFITEASCDKQGIRIVLNEPCPMNGRSMPSKEWFVSWDKIGKLLFGDNYTDETDIPKLKVIRSEHDAD